MYKKKHLILTCIITTLIVWGFACLLFTKILTPVYLDPVSKAKQMILDQYVTELTPEQLTKLNDGAIAGMVYSLQDPYSAYLNAESLDAYTEDKQEEYKGIGVQVNYAANPGHMTVVLTYDNSPAAKAGILPGDIIIRVGDTEVTEETYDAVLDHIRKGETDDIPFTVRRGEQTLSFTVYREPVEQQTVYGKMLPDNVGYIRVVEFIHRTDDEFAQAIKTLKEQGMQGLIIDLRNNGGGYAEAVIEMADSLIPKGVIAYLEDNQGRRQYFNSDANALQLPMVVLINQNTASASELLAGSLKSHGLATIVGEKSFGKAVGQSLYPLSDTTALYLTDAKYYTPSGECIHGVGIVPDVEVTLSEEKLGRLYLLSQEEDPQLLEGIRVLHEAMNP